MTKFLPEWLQQLADEHDKNNSTFCLSPIDCSPTTCNNVSIVKEHNGSGKMAKVIKKELAERKWHTGAALRKVVYWTVVNNEGRQIDGNFKTKKDAERALRLLPKSDA